MLAKTCEFHDTSDEIVDQVIEKCCSKKLRKRLLREPNIDLDKMLEIAQISETTDRQVKQYTNNKLLDPAAHESAGASDDEEINKINLHQGA